MGRLDRAALVRDLPAVEYKPEKGKGDDKDRSIGLADSLLSLGDLKPEKEWSLCQTVARHLLGELPEPDDLD
ncbi:MAG: hypothetical protein ABIO70_01645 [Pseudomonadota bacterium]